ncbi:MAG: hypothetical protein HY305_01090 [Sphingobacteriales bacterium]|nr:hypothetical protein [Sphingobacteriales bacterium]
MIIKTAIAEVKTKSHPVAKVVNKTGESQVLVITFQKGMILKEHKTSLPAKIIVLQGRIVYTIH